MHAGEYSGVVDCAVKLVRNEGALSLWKGYTPANQAGSSHRISFIDNRPAASWGGRHLRYELVHGTWYMDMVHGTWACKVHARTYTFPTPLVDGGPPIRSPRSNASTSCKASRLSEIADPGTDSEAWPRSVPADRSTSPRKVVLRVLSRAPQWKVSGG